MISDFKSILLIGLLAVSIGLCHAAPVASAQDAGTPVILGAVKKQAMSDRIEALGTLTANESITVSSQVTEVITHIHFDDGQRVKSGDVLAEMTNNEEHALLKEAEALVQEAEEQLQRASPLARKGITSDSQLSERRRDFHAASARLEAVKSRISDRIIKAPFDGVIGLRKISVGALVEPGTEVATIDDDSQMKLDFTIPATFLPSVSIGLPITAKATAFGERQFKGQVSSIDSRIDPVTRSIVLRAIIANPDGILRAGALMTVEIFRNPREAVVVSENAIVARSKHTYVYVVDPEAEAPVAKRREVSLGARQTGIVEVLDGLKVGELVVTDGTLRVRPDGSVKILAIEKAEEPLSDLLGRSSKQVPGSG